MAMGKLCRVVWMEESCDAEVTYDPALPWDGPCRTLYLRRLMSFQLFGIKNSPQHQLKPSRRKSSEHWLRQSKHNPSAKTLWLPRILSRNGQRTSPHLANHFGSIDVSNSGSASSPAIIFKKRKTVFR